MGRRQRRSDQDDAPNLRPILAGPRRDGAAEAQPSDDERVTQSLRDVDRGVPQVAELLRGEPAHRLHVPGTLGVMRNARHEHIVAVLVQLLRKGKKL